MSKPKINTPISKDSALLSSLLEDVQMADMKGLQSLFKDLKKDLVEKDA